MSLLQKLSGRHRDALRVFLMTLVVTGIFVNTPLYRLAELEAYDVRLFKWVDSLPGRDGKVILFQKLDSTRTAERDDEWLLDLLQRLQKNGVERVFLLGTSVFDDYVSVEEMLPSNVVVIEPQSTKALESKAILFRDATQLTGSLDQDGNLRRLPWDSGALNLARDVMKVLGEEPPSPRGESFRLRPLTAGSGVAESQNRGGSLPLESAERGLEANTLGRVKVVLIERATTEASGVAEVNTAVGDVTAGEAQMTIVEALRAHWSVVELGFAASSLVLVVMVGGFVLLLAGRQPMKVAAGALISLLLLSVSSYALLPLGFDAPIIAWLFGLFSASFIMVVFEIGKSRKILKSFGGSEDAQFEGEESEATMVFTNLPPYLLDMEREHDEDLLKFRRDYNEVLARVAERYHGKVLDFQGDAQMLGFGLRYDEDDEHAAEGTSAALEIVQGVGALASKWDVEPAKLRVHAGVCSGSIALGHLGAEQKQDIAAIGDTTNTAARLMGAAMKAKRPVLVSKSTYLASKGLIKGEELPPVELKGKSAPVEVFAALEVDTQWRIQNQAKEKDAVPTGGTLVHSGFRQDFLLYSLGWAFLGAVLTVVVWKDGLFDEAERKLEDAVHRHLLVRQADPNIVLIGIDDESRKDGRLGAYPFSRGVYGQAIKNLADTGYKGVFVDVMFKKARASDPLGDEHLASALADDQRAVVAGVLYRNEADRFEPPRLFPAADYKLLTERHQIGLIHNLTDPDGMTRLGFLSAEETASHDSAEAHLRQTFPSAAVALLLQEGDEFIIGDDQVTVGQTSFRARVNSKGRSAVGIRFGPPATADDRLPESGSYQHVSFNRLMDPSDPIFDQLKDKYLMMGLTMTDGDYNQIDRVSTIVGELKGVEVHARVLDSLLNDDYIRKIGRVPRYVGFFVVWLAALVVLTFYREPKAYLGRLAILGGVVSAAYLLALVVFSWHFELLILWLMIIAVTTSVMLGRYIFTFRALTRFVPAEVALELLFHQQARDRRQVATILLTDIRGYTTLSEGRTAVAMLDVLNEYHKRTVACYDRFGGQALTYQGDAQIVIFGVFGKRKNPAADGAAAALELQSICDTLREEWGIESRDDFDVGAGLCTGEVEVGLLGGGSNLQYSVVGETVRKAHKVQSLSAELEAPVILDEETFEATQGAVVVDDLGMVQPKGLPHEIRLYRAKSVNQD